MNNHSLTALNRAQLEAVTYGEGPLLLLAGPGSGKTTVITNRILYLLERGVPPERLLVITFTREAALSMQRRFQEVCGRLSCPVCFGTFHSVFYHILLESGAAGAGKILKNSEKKALMLSTLKQYAAQNGMEAVSVDGLREDAEKILSAVSFCKNTLKPREAVKRAPAQWQPHLEAVAAAYQKRVEEEGRIDFDDMLSKCLKLLQDNPEIRIYWQERFSHILIDEFQDINPVQYQAVRLLAGRPYNIFAVGDDDQAIYGFRGAEPDCLRRFAEEFGAGRLFLDANYRSSPKIVQASLAVIGENKNRFEKRMYAAQKDRGDFSGQVSCKALPGREEQYQYMAEVLRRASADGERCAVLFRTNSYMQGFAARLRRAEVPYEIREAAVSIYEHFIVKDILAYLELAQGSSSRELFLRIVNKPSRYVSREAVAECGADFARLRAYYEREPLYVSHRHEVIKGLETLEKQLKSMGRLSLRLGVEYCLRAAGYERYLKERAAGEDKWQEWQELLGWLKADAAQYAGLREWKEAQEAYAGALERGRAPSGGGAVQSAVKGRDNPIQLMTVHGAKGLEFDRVWIPDCNEKIFPHGSLPDEAAVEEERRIFYVAMTRAKKSLELLYLTGTEERPRQPSRFLEPLCPHR